MQVRKQATDRRRAAHACRQRSRCSLDVGTRAGNQRNVAIAEFAEGINQAARVIDQHAFDQLAERAFHRVFPAGIHVQAFADTRCRIQPTRLQPRHGSALLLAQRGLLQGFQRGQATAQAVGLLAQFGQFVLAIALLFLHGRHALLAQLDVFAQFIQCSLLRVVPQVQLLEGFFQRVHVQAGAFGGQRFTTPVGIEDLLVQVVHARALDIAGARGLRTLRGVLFPALLPAGQPVFGLAQAFLLDLVLFLQLFQLRGGGLHRFAQHQQFGLVAADVLTQFGQGLLGFVTRLVQALRQLALVLDLLLQARQRAADLVDRSLRGVERIGGLFASNARGLDAGLGVTLVGDQLLQLGLFLRQPFAQLGQATVQPAELQGLPLGILDPALFLQRLVLLGLLGLALEVFELLADLVAQVAQPVQVLTGVADAGLGLLATLLVLGDAGCLFQVHAQVFRARLDDLADHALLDDRVAARAQAGAEEQVGDVAATALGAVEVIVAGAVAADRALDRDLVERGVLAGNRVVGVVEDQLDRGLRHRLAGIGSGEDHVGQRVATQAAGRTLAHDPAHGVDDVRLAAAIGPHHAGHVGRQVQGGRIDERLEAGQLDRGKTHRGSGLGPASGLRLPSKPLILLGSMPVERV